MLLDLGETMLEHHNRKWTQKLGASVLLPQAFHRQHIELCNVYVHTADGVAGVIGLSDCSTDMR